MTKGLKGENKKSLLNRKAISCFFLVLLSDQLFKRIVEVYFKNNQSKNAYFFINYICNEGLAFGIHFNQILIIFINFLIIIFVLLIILFKIKDYKIGFTLLLIVGGAISNLTDRLTRGCVIDYIDLRVWPVFNLADAVIVLASFFLVRELFKKETKLSSNQVRRNS